MSAGSLPDIQRTIKQLCLKLYIYTGILMPNKYLPLHIPSFRNVKTPLPVSLGSRWGSAIFILLVNASLKCLQHRPPLFVSRWAKAEPHSWVVALSSSLEAEHPHALVFTTDVFFARSPYVTFNQMHGALYLLHFFCVLLSQFDKEDMIIIINNSIHSKSVRTPAKCRCVCT